MIPVSAPINMRILKIHIQLSVGIHFQYSFSIRCEFYTRIPMSTNFFDIPYYRIYLTSTFAVPDEVINNDTS